MTGFPVFDKTVPIEEARTLLMAEATKRMKGVAAVAVPHARVGHEMQDHSQLSALKERGNEQA